MATYDEKGNRIDEGFIGFGKKLGAAISAVGEAPGRIATGVREAVSPTLSTIAHGALPTGTTRAPAPIAPRVAAQQPAQTAAAVGGRTTGAVAPQATERFQPSYLRNERTGATYGFESKTPEFANNVRFTRTAPQARTPEEEAMSAYEQTLSRFKGDTPELALAADLMTRRAMRDASAIRGERGSMERAELSERGATERAALSERGAASRARAAAAPTEESAARAALLREQARGASFSSEEAARASLANRVLMDPQKYTPNQVAQAREYVNRKQQQELEKIYARTGELAPGGEAFADGGVVGGRTQAEFDPAVTKYGQYLSAAASAGVPPVPFTEYLNLLGSTQKAMNTAPATFANGGEVDRQEYPRPGEIGWKGVIGSGVKRLFGAPEAAAQPAPAPVSAPVQQEETVEQAAQREADEFLKATRGYADGGAIDVAGKMLEGPGTGRSDSIPAIINGTRPAKLSDGEFVIPAHVVKAKGTEFFERLLAQYEDKV